MNRSVALALLVGCNGDAADSVDAASTSCDLVANTSPSGRTTPSGCEILDRDTSSCAADRMAAGLDGVWLKFSCRVELAMTSTAVTAAADGQPDFTSNYFALSHPCWESYTGAIQNPNSIVLKSYAIEFPRAPNSSPRTMQMTAVVGLTINGIPIYGNFAAPGDDIFTEAQTFDRCGGHPQMAGAYHNHSEPLSISYDDANLVGVMRDGYAIYGRKDADGQYPALDPFGGHTGPTTDSASDVYHYHVNQQTSSNPGTAGQTQWFLTTGMYRGTPGSCTGC
ncbi:MAG: YHYH protein [Kofleriaceae bacterium]